MAEETTERRHGNPVAVALFCGAILFVLYIVSPVPVAFVVNHSGRPGRFPPIVINIYSPFAWAEDHTFLRKPILRYGHFLNKI